VRRRLFILLLLPGACLAGVVSAFSICGSIAGRDAIGMLFGRGHLLALARGRGIYEVDLERALSESRYANGANEKDRQDIDERLVLGRLVSNAEARSLAAQEKISGAEVERELNFLRWQFRDEKSWTSALQDSGLSVGSLRRNVADDLRARHWVFRQVTSHADVTADECRHFYEANQDSFLQPARLRASHLFLAAPPETPPEIVDAKRAAIESLSTRLASGENFAELVAEASEDEATKTRGGDLGYFSASRMPTDFFFEVLNLRVGQISQPIRTRLGFHLVELTDLMPARQIALDEAGGDVAAALEDRKRGAALEKLDVDLCADASWLGGPR
jgi:parvulin-like peptidyl-prolyl isomerase